ncbi:hypothetical protein CBER1_11942 [Cercospora berteroae]|uniref:Uncharacterized protein n=1 Tax=Cercospora berteroae TaxID=357750 RepID=A0A2S6CNM0_9PEZI|nr:hypothetical protein CBER1_11942 [Cercospora berteroae]
MYMRQVLLFAIALATCNALAIPAQPLAGSSVNPAENFERAEQKRQYATFNDYIPQTDRLHEVTQRKRHEEASMEDV